MTSPIEGTLPLFLPHALLEPRPSLRPAEGKEGKGIDAFEQVLRGVVADANRAIGASEQTGAAFAAGVRDDIHGTMLALSKAEIELRFVGNVRNRVIDAFFELWRMQI